MAYLNNLPQWVSVLLAMVALMGSAFITGLKIYESRRKESKEDKRMEAEEIEATIEDKKDAGQCEAYQEVNEAAHKRIGGAIDCVEESIKEGNKRFEKIEKCLVYMVSKDDPKAARELGLI